MKRVAPGQVLVTGDVVGERVIDTADLDARANAGRDVSYVTRYRREVHRVRGVALHEVLTELRPRWDERHKMGQLNVVVLAVSEDGFQVALSLAEIDPEFGACAALLATRYNGAVLARPTLVMPCDGRASRYVRSLSRLCLFNVAPWEVLSRSRAISPST
ncbi:molybdopterin-binding protein [Amycolatopsis sp. K13G38]|uniref:Molybdopterin-binding protein n=1 Tax=Amycolatopsis acididurans TaxID=2724524 RepID=A0ABX1J533_9PSEU|nr:molybdopterin-binding protein [Amycolatopsis acididurans]NKQ54724.1 molybdopterin-binding protein [Amycolatopsis acididurans]